MIWTYRGVARRPSLSLCPPASHSKEHLFSFFQQRSREILSVFVFLFIPLLFALEEFLFGPALATQPADYAFLDLHFYTFISLGGRCLLLLQEN